MLEEGCTYHKLSEGFKALENEPSVDQGPHTFSLGKCWIGNRDRELLNNSRLRWILSVCKASRHILSDRYFVERGHRANHSDAWESVLDQGWLIGISESSLGLVEYCTSFCNELRLGVGIELATKFKFHRQ